MNSSMMMFLCLLLLLPVCATESPASPSTQDFDGEIDDDFTADDLDEETDLDFIDDDVDEELNDDLPSTYDIDKEIDHSYIVEVLAVLDKPMYEKWLNAAGAGTREKVVEEVKSFFKEVDIIYQSLIAYNISIEIRLKDIVFANDSIVPARKVKGNVVYTEAASNAFGWWLRKNNYTDFDHAMHITSFDLRSTSLSVAGSARQNGVCKQGGTSRIEGGLKYTTIKTAAHEIGHSLGANHDNPENSVCRGYVMMSGGYPGTRKRWYFSRCSAKAFKRTLGRRGPDSCLKRTTTDPIVARRWGELVHKNDWCKRFYGTMVAPRVAWGDNLCNVLRCVKKYTSRSSRKVNTPEGVSCGTNKQCFMGYCV